MATMVTTDADEYNGTVSSPNNNTLWIILGAAGAGAMLITMALTAAIVATIAIVATKVHKRRKENDHNDPYGLVQLFNEDGIE